MFGNAASAMLGVLMYVQYLQDILACNSYLAAGLLQRVVFFSDSNMKVNDPTSSLSWRGRRALWGKIFMADCVTCLSSTIRL